MELRDINNMRTVKFRAWDKIEKRMLSDFGLWDLHDDGQELEHGNGSLFVGNRQYQLFHKGEFEFMQFTGLLDKNGKEIYEADYIDFNGLEYEIIFEHGSWFAKCLTTGPNPDGTESKRPDEWLFDFHKLVQIIGNKYEN
jgi:uncharacterized phage protein (TIGR01671 family)